MQKFLISTDSTADLYAAYMQEHDVRCVSLTYIVEKDGQFSEELDAYTDYDQYVNFFRRLRGGAFSRTSMLNYESHYEHFLKLAKEGAEDVVHFTISSGLSPTVTVAEQAAEAVRKDYPAFRVFAVDSLTATIGQGALVRAAVRLRDEGKTAEETFAYVKDLTRHIQYAIIANDLFYLKRGGRVSAVAAVAGSVLQVKPVLSFTREGKLAVVEKCRGMKKAFVYALDKMRKFEPVREHPLLWIVHTDAEKEANEFADLIAVAGREIELPISRIAAKARAVGIHMILATQRPDTKVITGTIKSNFPSRIAFKVASMVDSRTILDAPGANRLIGRGDMLIVVAGQEPVRVQCAFVDTPEVEGIVNYIGEQTGFQTAYLLPDYVPEGGESGSSGPVDLSDRDPLFEEAARLIVIQQQGSTSLIQRKFAIGYNRAGRLMDQLEAAGIVGPFEGSKARQVLVQDEYSLEQLLNAL